MQRFKVFIDKLNDFIVEYCLTRQSTLGEAVEDLVRSGGKRIRPLLVMLASRVGNELTGRQNNSRFLKIAAGVELLHMATLVHDDIIDEAKLRRGRISAQEKFGKDIAVFIGDYLLTKSNMLLSQNLSKNNFNRLNKVVKLVCEGEINQYQNRYSLDISISDYLKRIRRKTAVLFGLCTYLGASEAGLKGVRLFKLYKTGLQIGFCFQIQDDILDFTGKEFKTGKKIGQDLKAGIYTLPLIYLMEDKQYSQQVKDLLVNSFTEQLTKNEIDTITGLAKKSRAIRRSKIMEKRFLDKAETNIGFLEDSKNKDDLKYILKWQLEREQ